MKTIFSLGLICLSFLLPFSSIAQEMLTNEAIWYSSEFRTDYVSGVNSMNDGIHYTSLEYSDENGSEIVKYAYATGKKVDVIATSLQVFKDKSKIIENYEFSADEKKLLLETESQSIYRHSFTANYYIWDMEARHAFPLADFSKGQQRLATFSPTGDQVAFVRDNNIFISDLQYREEVQVTFDGKMNEIINGFPDWVYEEEFGFSRGFFWSPGGNRIAYYKFDESQVRQFQMAMYGDLYPNQYTYKYPKAGEKNSAVSIYVYDTEAMMSKRVDLGNMTDIYVPRIKWTLDNNKLCVMRMNRHQNHLEFLLTDMSKAQPFELQTTKIFDETSDTYIDISDDLTFLADGKSFLWTSERDGFNHVYRFDMKGNVTAQLTSGEWDVIEFLGADEAHDKMFFTASKESAIEQHIYTGSLKKNKVSKLSEKPGHHEAVFSNTFEYYIDYYSNANEPYYITLNNQKGKEIRVLVDNTELKNALKKYNLQPKEFFTFNNSAGTALNCWMIKPPNFDPAKQYPV
ncbi:MAG: DPP IV N-terminal domain-containing protein, partial [Flavobacteriales bacterium]|nr:DPP IV N-terminal domain-containing protein [Flavobacteriales bacterium]